MILLKLAHWFPDDFWSEDFQFLPIADLSFFQEWNWMHFEAISKIEEAQIINTNNKKKQIIRTLSSEANLISALSQDIRHLLYQCQQLAIPAQLLILSFQNDINIHYLSKIYWLGSRLLAVDGIGPRLMVIFSESSNTLRSLILHRSPIFFLVVFVCLFVFDLVGNKILWSIILITRLLMPILKRASLYYFTVFFTVSSDIFVLDSYLYSRDKTVLSMWIYCSAFRFPFLVWLSQCLINIMYTNARSLAWANFKSTCRDPLHLQKA